MTVLTDVKVKSYCRECGAGSPGSHLCPHSTNKHFCRVSGLSSHAMVFLLTLIAYTVYMICLRIARRLELEAMEYVFMISGRVAAWSAEGVKCVATDEGWLGALTARAPRSANTQRYAATAWIAEARRFVNMGNGNMIARAARKRRLW